LEPEKIDVLNVWQNFISELPEEVNPYRPLWSMEFGATYPVDVKWEDLNLKNWQQYKGAYGFPLSKCKNIDEINSNLPNYVKSQKGIPPKWKQNYILGNRQFYNDNKGFIKDKTLRRIERFDQESWKKFEWNCQGELRSFSDKLIQFRGSGVRIKRNNYIPSLVTVSTQIPVVGKYMRYIIPEEGARAQSLPMDIQLPDSKTGSFRVLGNMVNVELVLRIAKSLLSNSVQNNNYCDSQILENEVLSQT
jgi:DNA (cytosine-5)-methyltransferase 1